MYHLENLNSWNIDVSCYNFICQILKKGSTILEFGSGYGTHILSQHFTMFSVENNPDWLNKYNSTYIWSPIELYGDKLPPKGFESQKGWYKTENLKNTIPNSYDLILIDGPEGKWGRAGILNFLPYLNTSVPIIVDDIERPDEAKLLKELVSILGKNVVEIKSQNSKKLSACLI